MAISNNAHNAARFVAIATVETGHGTRRETATFEPTATMAEVFEAFFAPKDGFSRIGSTVSSIELLPDVRTIPREHGLFDTDFLERTEGWGTEGPEDPPESQLVK